MPESLSISELMRTSGVGFGTSGARGTVAAMTDRVCWSYTTAFLQALQARGETPTAIAIAGDLRPSTGRIMAACAHAAKAAGIRVEHCGRVPSPAVALFGLVSGTPTIMVTGSHIPDDRNGIKFTTRTGEITKADEEAIRSQSVQVPDLFDADGMLHAPHDIGTVNPTAANLYIARYVDWFGTTALQGLSIGLYQHSSVGRDIAGEILTALGASVEALGRSEAFLPVDTEAIRPEDSKAALEWAQGGRFQAIVSMDGDADRPLLSDEQGHWLRGDVLGILVSRILGVTRIAIPVSCNSAAESCKSFENVVRTRIGSPFVIAGMESLYRIPGGPVAGYEANGGYLLQSPLGEGLHTLQALPTRDAMLPILAVLAEVARTGRSVSSLLAELPTRFTASDRLKEFPTATSLSRVAELGEGGVDSIGKRLTALLGEDYATVVSVDQTDGLRMTLQNGDVVHLRPSGNAPELRCYAESTTAERASAIVVHTLSCLDKAWRMV